MGTSSSPAQLAGKLDKLAVEMGNPTPALSVVARDAKKTFLATAGGAKALGKVAGRRKAIGARYNMGRKGTGKAWVVVLYTGPAHLLNNPTKAHDIFPRKRPGVRTRSKRGATRLKFTRGDGKYAMYSHTKGTKGKHFFEKAKVIVEHEAPRTFQKEGLTKPLHKVFG